MKEYMKKVKTPILVAMVIQAFSLLLAGLVILAQKSVVTAFYGVVASGEATDGRVIPYGALINIIIHLLLFFIFYLVVITKSGNKSVISIVFIVVTVLIRFATFFIPVIITRYMVASGEKTYVVYTVLENAVGQLTGPFTLVAFIFFCISLGRYGIMDMFELREKLVEDDPRYDEEEKGGLKKVKDTDDQYL